MRVRRTDVKPRPQRRLLMAALLLASLQAWSAEPLEQDTISIEGNRGLPKTIYIAPWKRVDEPLEGAEFNTGPGREPVPVERELLQRELELHREGYSVE
jgi:hypothetical protein